VQSNLTRRTFTGGIAWVVGSVSGVAQATRAYSEETEETNKEVSFRWSVPVAQYEIVKSSLKFTGTVTTEHDNKGLPLVIIFVGISLLPALVDAILTVRRKLVQPGLKIDTRGAEIKIEIDPDLPRGMILVVDTSGAKIYESNQLSMPTELIKVLTNAKAE